MKKKAELAGRRCKLVAQRRDILDSGDSRKAPSLRLVDREIAVVDSILASYREKEKKSLLYCNATIKISLNGDPAREVKVSIMDQGIDFDPKDNEYTVAKDSLLACAILKAPVNGVVEFGSDKSKTVIRVIEREIF